MAALKHQCRPIVTLGDVLTLVRSYGYVEPGYAAGGCTRHDWRFDIRRLSTVGMERHVYSGMSSGLVYPKNSLLYQIASDKSAGYL